MAQQKIAKELLDKYGQLFSEEIGIDLKEGTPSALFQWLFSSTMFSARIGSNISVTASKALIDQGWTTPEKMKNTTWEQRVKVLNSAHYTRYQEKTSTFLGEVSEKLIEDYQGNLKKLKEAAGDDLKKLRKLLKEFKGMGDVGVDIFLREAQVAWTDIYPFADKKALQVAKKLDLPDKVGKLYELVSRKDLPRLLAALIRVDLNNDYKLDKEKHKGQQNLENLSKEKLYKKAQKKQIKGRSKMSKKELIEVLEDV